MIVTENDRVRKYTDILKEVVGNRSETGYGINRVKFLTWSPGLHLRYGLTRKVEHSFTVAFEHSFFQGVTETGVLP